MLVLSIISLFKIQSIDSKGEISEVNVSYVLLRIEILL